MFFSKLKKINKSKKGLPENLLELQESEDTVWVWDPDYNMLVWANDIGMEFWKAKSRIELKELVFPTFHPMMQVSLEALHAVKKGKGKGFIKGLPLVTYPEEIIYDCHFTLQILPDGREGLLVTIPQSKQPENTHTTSEQTSEQQEESLELLDLEYDDADLASLESADDMLATDDLDMSDNLLETDILDTPQTDAEIPTNDAEMQPSAGITPQILVDETLFTAPLTISVHENGFLLGADERTNFYIQANPQTRFEHLFTTPVEAAPIIDTALQSEQNSFVTRLTIQEQDLPFVIQTFSLIHEGQNILNVAMLRITEEQYHDHAITIQDAQQVNDGHEHKKILTEDEIENSPVIVEEVTEIPAIIAAKPTEPEIHTIPDSTTTAMFETDKNGIILDCNNMSKTLTGLFKEDLVGRPIGAIFDEHTAQNISHFIQHNETDSGEYVDGKECYFHGEDNSNRHGIIVIRPVQRATDGFLFLLTDNTEVKNIQKDINALKQEAKKEPSSETVPEKIPETLPVVAPEETTHTALSPVQEKIVPDYLAHISHELRAPLNAISGYTELLKAEPFGAIDPHYKDYIHSLHIAAHHAKEVVDDLLDYAKLEAGGFTADISETDLSDVIENALVLIRPQATFKNIDIQTTLFTGTPNIKADARLLKQVLCNILSNAIKYSDEDENIYIATGITKTKRFMIEVTNFGSGMTEEQIETAMQPYGRLQNDKNIKGTGLGLPLAKRFTELMDGHFLIHSVPNEKTRVRIIFEEDKVIYSE